MAPELRTANRSPALPAAYSSPPVAPYRQVLPMITVSRATKVEPCGGCSTMLARRHALAHIVVGIAFQVQVQAAGIPHAEALAGASRCSCTISGASLMP